MPDREQPGEQSPVRPVPAEPCDPWAPPEDRAPLGEPSVPAGRNGPAARPGADTGDASSRRPRGHDVPAPPLAPGMPEGYEPPSWYPAPAGVQGAYGRQAPGAPPYGAQPNTSLPNAPQPNAPLPIAPQSYDSRPDTSQPYEEALGRTYGQPYGGTHGQAHDPYAWGHDPYGEHHRTQDPYGEHHRTQDPYGEHHPTQDPYGQYQQPYHWPPARPDNGFGTAALIIGIVSALLAPTVVLGILLGVLGVVFGVVGRAKVAKGEATNGGVALAGIVLGGVGLLLSALMVVFLALGSLDGGTDDGIDEPYSDESDYSVTYDASAAHRSPSPSPPPSRTMPEFCPPALTTCRVAD